jgi:hypothetical protein
VDNAVLRQTPLFSSFDDEALESLQSSMSDTELKRGDVLFREGDSGDRLYVVADGKIKLGRTAPDGRENLLAVLGPGQMFGELSLFDPGPRSATATAVTNCWLARPGPCGAAGMALTTPDVARACCSAASRLRRTIDVVADLVFSDCCRGAGRKPCWTWPAVRRETDGGLRCAPRPDPGEPTRPAGRSAARDGEHRRWRVFFAQRGWLSD